MPGPIILAFLQVYQAAIAISLVCFLASVIMQYGGHRPVTGQRPGQDMFTMNLIMPQKKP